MNGLEKNFSGGGSSRRNSQWWGGMTCLARSVVMRIDSMSRLIRHWMMMVMAASPARVFRGGLKGRINLLMRSGIVWITRAELVSTE